MTTTPLPPFAALVFALGLAPAAGAQERADAHGDPLPPGAYARLGTNRGYNGYGWQRNSVLAPGGKVVFGTGGYSFRWVDPVTGRDTGPAVQTDDREDAGEPVAVAADGKRGVFALTREARVYDLATGKRLATIPPSAKVNPRSAVISADGGTVAVGQGDHPYGPPAGGVVSALVWDVAGDREVARVRVADEGAAVVALTPDGKTLLTRKAFEPSGKPVPPDTRVTRAWDAATGKPLGTLEAGGRFYNFVFAADSSLGAGLDLGGNTVEVFEPRTGKRVRTLADPPASPQALAFAPDGKSLLTVAFHTLDATRWDLATGRPAARAGRPTDLPPGGSCRGLTYTAAGKPLAWGVWDGNTALAWDPVAARPLTPAVRHVASLVGVAFTADGKQVVTTDGAGVNLRWDAETGKPVGPIRVEPPEPGRPGPVVYPSPDAARGFSVKAAYDLSTGKTLDPYPGVSPTSYSWSAARPLPGGRVALLARTGVRVGSPVRCVVWDPAAGKAVFDAELPPASPSYVADYAVALTPDGATLVAGYEPEPKAGEKPAGAEVRAWDVATGRAKWERSFPAGRVAVAATPDGKTLAVVARRRVEVLDAGTGKTVGGFGGGEVSGWPPVFTPDGRRCVVSVLENLPTGRQRIEMEVRSWPDGKVLAALPDPGGPAAVSPDGTRLATNNGLSALLWRLPEK